LLSEPEREFESSDSEASLVRNDSSCADETAAIPGVSEPDHLDVSAALRRVHHAPAPEVETDVPKSLEEEKVAGLHS
jgi:hypothetical protein